MPSTERAVAGVAPKEQARRARDNKAKRWRNLVGAIGGGMSVAVGVINDSSGENECQMRPTGQMESERWRLKRER